MSESISSEFLGLVADAQAAVDAAEMFNDWTPPGSAAGNSYPSLFKSVKTGAGENKKTKQQRVWIALEFEVIAGEFQGRNYTVFFSSDVAFRMGDLFNLASMAENDPTFASTKQLLPAVEALVKHAGSLVVDVVSKEKEKDGRTYTNLSFDRIIDRVSQ